MEDTTLITIGSALVAGIAALYARWAAIAAQRANEIAIHNERLKIYKAIWNHHATLATRGPHYPEDALWVFHDAVQLSEFYFGTSEYEALKGILGDSFEILNLSGLWDITKSQGEEKYSSLVEKTNMLHRKTRDRCAEVAVLLKPKLRIGNNL